MRDSALFFAAVIPPDPVKSAIQKRKLEISNQYHSRRSLNAPPHITVLNPFRIEKKNHGQLVAFLKAITLSQEPFKVNLNGISHFEENVIYIKVMETPGLFELQKKMDKSARQEGTLFSYHYKEKSYRPHITLAFKDLTEDNFQRAWERLKDDRYEASFEAGGIHLLMHNGRQWMEDVYSPFRH